MARWLRISGYSRIMTNNHKLTSVIKGRTISGTANQGAVLTILFDDGSKMAVQTAGAASRLC